MNEQLENSIPQNDSQHPAEEIEAEPTLNEMASSVLKGFFYDGRPPEFWADWLKEALEGMASIPEEISYLTSAVEELTEAIREHNRLRDEAEPPETTTQRSRPLKPPPQDKPGGRYVNL